MHLKTKYVWNFALDNFWHMLDLKEIYPKQDESRGSNIIIYQAVRNVLVFFSYYDYYV
jgi:hypothetical protein